MEKIKMKDTNRIVLEASKGTNFGAISDEAYQLSRMVDCPVVFKFNNQLYQALIDVKEVV